MAKKETEKPLTPAEKAQAEAIAREEQYQADLAHRRHISRLQDELAATVRLQQLAEKDPTVAALLAERDALKARVAALEAAVAPKS